MSTVPTTAREGGLDAPTRHPLDWKNPEFYDQASLDKELERVFHICHGCRRCVSLCNAFPTLFDLVDESSTMEVDGVAKSDYVKVVEQCYLCDLCYQTKCPYIPPHPWDVDFPHLMLRAKATAHRRGETGFAARLLSNTTTVGKLASIPLAVNVVNAANRNPTARKLIDKALGVDPRARVPDYHSDTARRRQASEEGHREKGCGQTGDGEKARRQASSQESRTQAASEKGQSRQETCCEESRGEKACRQESSAEKACHPESPSRQGGRQENGNEAGRQTSHEKAGCAGQAGCETSRQASRTEQGRTEQGRTRQADTGSSCETPIPGARQQPFQRQGSERHRHGDTASGCDRRASCISQHEEKLVILNE